MSIYTTNIYHLCHLNFTETKFITLLYYNIQAPVVNQKVNEMESPKSLSFQSLSLTSIVSQLNPSLFLQLLNEGSNEKVANILQPYPEIPGRNCSKPGVSSCSELSNVRLEYQILLVVPDFSNT